MPNGEIAESHGATPRHVALAFLVRPPFLFAIPKASTSERAAENAGAGNLRLSPRDILRIDRAFPLVGRAASATISHAIGHRRPIT